MASFLLFICGALFYVANAFGSFVNFYFPPIPPSPTSPSNFFLVNTLVDDKSLFQPSYNSDGSLISAHGSSYYEQTINQLFVIDLNSRQTVLNTQEGVWTALALSPDGTHIAASGENILPGPVSGVYLIEVKSNKISYLSAGDEPTWSADSRLLAIVRQTEERADPERRIQIWVYDLTTNVENLVFDEPSSNGWIIDLAWSPNGKMIAFSMILERPAKSIGFFDLYVLNLEVNTLDRLTNGKQDVVSPNFSPNGDRILYIDRSPPLGAGGGLIKVVDLNGRCHRLVSPVPGITGAAISRDGKKVALDTSHGLLTAETSLIFGEHLWSVGDPCSNP